MTVEGMGSLNRKLGNMDRATRGKALETAVLSGLNLIVNEAKERVHILTGNLQRSIHAEAHADGTTAEGRAGTNVDYAQTEEFRPGDHAYLRPAYDEQKEAAKREVREALRLLIRQSARE